MVDLKARLAAGEIPIGAGVIIPSVDVVEILSYHFDWLVVDLEHSAITLGDLPDMIRTAERWDTATLVRVPDADSGRVNRILDTGADGIVYPHVTSKADAEAAVAATFYPPLGERSVGYARAQRYGADRIRQVREANDSILCMVLVEDQAGVDNVESIVSVDGVDALMVGPNDLAASKGSFANARSDDDVYDVHDDVEHVAETAIEHGVTFGYPAADPEAIDDVLALGSRLVLSLFASAMLNATVEERADDLRLAIRDHESA